MSRGPIADAGQRIRHVFLRDMTLQARIGVYAHEQLGPQRIRINVDLGVDEGDPATQSDEIGRVVDYERLASRVRGVVAAGHVRLVETLAERIAQTCLTDARVLLVRVRVEKLDVFPDATSAGVEIERTR